MISSLPEFHPLASPPAWVECSRITRCVRLPLSMPPQPLFSGPAFQLPGCLLWDLHKFPLPPPSSCISFFGGDAFFRRLLCMRHFYTFKFVEHKLLTALLNRSACAAATYSALALHWLEALALCADLIASKQWSFSLWQFNSLDVYQKSKLLFQICKFMSIFCSFFVDLL